MVHTLHTNESRLTLGLASPRGRGSSGLCFLVPALLKPWAGLCLPPTARWFLQFQALGSHSRVQRKREKMLPEPTLMRMRRLLSSKSPGKLPLSFPGLHIGTCPPLLFQDSCHAEIGLAFYSFVAHVTSVQDDLNKPRSLFSALSDLGSLFSVLSFCIAAFITMK